ncbi:MAG TPA: hypothetical protein VKI64_09260, partial [Acidimicrobiales bacterium]|nr:hypothetical protein [Acidimicrobiales bacterium]
VLGLLVWLSLGAQISLYGAEINVVRARHLWPRSMVQPPIVEGDRRSYEQMAQVEKRRPEEDVRVSFGDQTEEEDRRSEQAALETEPGRPPSGERGPLLAERSAGERPAN